MANDYYNNITQVRVTELLATGAEDPSATAQVSTVPKELSISPVYIDGEELEQRGGLDETELWFFERLLYSYKADEKDAATTRVEAWPGGPTWSGPVARAPEGPADYQSVIAIARRLVVDGETTDMAGVWSRPLDVYRSSPLVASRAEPQPDEPLIESSARVVMVEFMKNVLDFLTATRELVEQYNTPELVKSHFNLWGVMRAAELP